ncbi:MAG: DnaA/Hda family protein [Fimbriimonas sp.]|nr:DnaA/Hda family protein [Fimbriimonas sp.]
MATLDEAYHLDRAHLVNRIGSSEQTTKISKVLFERRETSFNSLAALPSNVQAIEAALMFSAGYNPFVALIGPSGWGKSHLLSAVSSRLSHELATSHERYSVSDYLASLPRADVNGPLLLDDVQDALGKSRLKMSLRLNLERRVRCGKPTIVAFTSPKPSRALRAFLPFPREWTIATMGAAEPAERVLLLHQMSIAEGLLLSPRLSKVIADQMHGNGRTLSGALKRLRLSGTNWLDPSATLRAFGLLDPFFADNGIWDLKHKILKIADSCKEQFPAISSTDLALYTLLHEAGLSEVSVARAAGIEPADAYLRAASFKLHAEEMESIRSHIRQFVDQVVDSLARD